MPRPRAAIGGSAIWALDDFTADNGATEVIPGSHRWADERPLADDPQARKIVMPAGSVVVFQGTPQYCQPWARQLENMALAVPLEAAARCPRRVQEMLGFSIHPPLMGPR